MMTNHQTFINLSINLKNEDENFHKSKILKYICINFVLLFLRPYSSLNLLLNVSALYIEAFRQVEAGRDNTTDVRLKARSQFHT